ncbi:hypothetical protein MMC12_003671 [Toensbergia leucococca]|nr:hypothetical protein [Toensbergia leucococca]
MDPVDVLILGAGWISTFLISLLESTSLTHAATTTTGHNYTIPYKYDPENTSPTPYKTLPSAKTILITFPLKGSDQSKQLTSLYRSVHGPTNNWIQLGSTGIFTAPHWNDCTSSYNTTNDRAIAEDELLSLGGCVLNLAGLYGGERDPQNWVIRVAKTKEEVRGKKALHMIHGQDVARAIVAVHGHFTGGKRWLLTDLRVNDWWDLIQDWGTAAQVRAKDALGLEAAGKLEYGKWVLEVMEEEGVRALPRGPENLGRVLDSRAFWVEMGLWPSQGRVGAR